jgi:hypothetical protein
MYEISRITLTKQHFFNVLQKIDIFQFYFTLFLIYFLMKWYWKTLICCSIINRCRWTKKLTKKISLYYFTEPYFTLLYFLSKVYSLSIDEKEVSLPFNFSSQNRLIDILKCGIWRKGIVQFSRFIKDFGSFSLNNKINQIKRSNILDIMS